MKKIKVILVDDERYCTETLAMQINGLGMDVEILAKFNDSVDALAFISTTAFDLLFLDIEMPKMSGFDLLSRLGEFHFDVVFTTAYDRYAIKAFRYSALNYLLKPIDDLELRKSFELHARNKEKHLNRELFSHFLGLLSGDANVSGRVAIPVDDGYEFIKVDDIIRCEADNYYTHLITTDGSDKLVCRTLKEVTNLLKSSGFVRIHQSHLVNPAHIRRISRRDGGTVITIDNQALRVSKVYRPAFLQLVARISKL